MKFQIDSESPVETPVVHNSLNPIFNFKHYFVVNDPLSILSFIVLDKDLTSTSFMGRGTVPINSLLNRKWQTLKIKLEGSRKHSKSEKVGGTLIVKLYFHYNRFSYILAHFSPRVQDTILHLWDHENIIETTVQAPVVHVEQFSPSKFTYHIMRIINVIWPFLEFYWAFGDLVAWSNPLTSAVAMVLWVILCLNTHLIPLTISLFLIWHILSHNLQSLGQSRFLKKAPQPKKSKKGFMQQYEDLKYTQASLKSTADMLCQIVHLFDWSNKEITYWMLWVVIGLSIGLALIPFHILLMIGGIYLFVSNTRIYLGLYYLLTQSNPRYTPGESMWDILPTYYSKDEASTDDS